MLQSMIASFVCCGTFSVLLTAFSIVWIVPAAVKLTYGVRQGLDVMLAGLNKE